MNFRAKSIIKKVALILAGITAVTAAGFGVKALVDYTKDDLKTITPTFEVGNLGSDGKFVDDKSTLYTKEAFEAEGLQIKLDFDSQINYQIFYYDDLDNFVESTSVLSTAYSETAHDGYARLVIIPTDDEDEKIRLVERVTYPSQMEIKVNKEQDSYYSSFYGRHVRFVKDVSLLRFNKGDFSLSNGKIEFSFDVAHNAITSKDVLCVNGGENISFNYLKTDGVTGVLRVTQIKNVGTSFIVTHFDEELKDSLTLDKDTDFVIFKFYLQNEEGSVVVESISDSVLNSISSSISILK